MNCRKCGVENDAANFRCTGCRSILQPAQPEAAQEKLETDPALRFIIPVGRSGLAIAAGYAGLFAALVIPAPLALILGILAVVDIRRHPGRLGMGRAIFGIVMGVIGTGILILLLASGAMKT